MTPRRPGRAPDSLAASSRPVGGGTSLLTELARAGLALLACVEVAALLLLIRG